MMSVVSIRSRMQSLIALVSLVLIIIVLGGCRSAETPVKAFARTSESEALVVLRNGSTVLVDTDRHVTKRPRPVGSETGAVVRTEWSFREPLGHRHMVLLVAAEPSSCKKNANAILKCDKAYMLESPATEDDLLKYSELKLKANPRDVQLTYGQEERKSKTPVRPKKRKRSSPKPKPYCPPCPPPEPKEGTVCHVF